MTPVQLCIVVLWCTLCASLFIIVVSACISTAIVKAYQGILATHTARKAWLTHNQQEQP